LCFLTAAKQERPGNGNLMQLARKLMKPSIFKMTAARVLKNLFPACNDSVPEAEEFNSFCIILAGNSEKKKYPEFFISNPAERVQTFFTQIEITAKLLPVAILP